MMNQTEELFENTIRRLWNVTDTPHWWVEYFSPRPLTTKNMIICILGMSDIIYYENFYLLEDSGLGGTHKLHLRLFIYLATLTFGPRIVTDTFNLIGKAIVQPCNELSTPLLAYYGLRPNSDVITPEYIANIDFFEFIFILVSSYIGASIGTILIIAPLVDVLDTLKYYLTSIIIDHLILFLGTIPGAIFGLTAGRLLYHCNAMLDNQDRRDERQTRPLLPM